MYKYTEKSLLDNPINYSYSPYEGDQFLNKWLIHRLSYCEEVNQNHQSNNNSILHPKLPSILYTNISKHTKREEDLCELLLQKYESTKKIYSQYIDNKPNEKSGFKKIENYIATAIIIEDLYSKTKEIRYLNCLLKLCDLFQSDKRFLLYSSNIKGLISKEINHIAKLRSEKSNLIFKENETSEKKIITLKKPTQIIGLVLLCCNSSRSSIYIQSLINANIYPEHIIYMNDNRANNKIKRYPYENLNCSPDWLFVPKEYINPIEIAKEKKINCIQIKTKSVNSKVIHECLKKIKSKLIIYCGFGGEIVSKELLKYFSFIHCHAGTLPKFRGSTTFYYEILSKSLPSVSCIFLDEKIDTGPIIAIKSFPIPYKTDNIDNLYEPCIRANLLSDLICNSGISLHLKPKVQTNKENPKNYYIIHPVLKHVSISFFKDCK